MDSICQSLINPNKEQIHLNPSLPVHIQHQVQKIVSEHPEKENRVWIMSSGTSSTSSSSFKLIALTHSGFIASAKSVNKHLAVSKTDRWLNVLPLFHVGGLGILYRSNCSETDCLNLWTPHYKWNPIEFIKTCSDNEVTLSSLVPTQIFDLIKTGIKAPPHLRAIVVGGARLNFDLYLKARTLGWPLLPSFGMTEVCSQIATSSLQSLAKIPSESPPLLLLSHILARTNESGQLEISSPSLLCGYYPIIDGKQQLWVNPINQSGWYVTQDCANLENGNINVYSRIDEVIKVRGENVNLCNLRNKIEGLVSQSSTQIDCTIVALPDERVGNKLILVGSESKEKLSDIAHQFNFQVLPFERIETIIENVNIPRSSLGKILYQQLLSLINNESQK